MHAARCIMHGKQWQGSPLAAASSQKRSPACWLPFPHTLAFIRYLVYIYYHSLTDMYCMSCKQVQGLGPWACGTLLSFTFRMPAIKKKCQGTRGTRLPEHQVM